MANYDNLRAAINQAITANGVGAITGLLLNSVLQAMVTALGNGYQFVGVATPSTNPGNPDQNVFYLAYEGGTYVNFGQLQVTRGFNIIKRDNVTWSVEQLTSVDDVLTANGNNPVTSGAAFGIGTNIAFYDLTLSPAVYPANVGANVVAKTITITGFKLMSGGCIRVKFPNNNTATQPTLNISETGAKPLYYNNKRVSVTNTWKANEVVEFYYDGTNWQGKKAVEVFKTINSLSLLGDGNIPINDFYFLEYGEDAEEAINVLSSTNRQVVCYHTITTPTLQEVSIKMFAHSFNASTGKIDFSGVVGNILYYCSVTAATQWSEVQTLDLSAEEQETYRMTYGSTGNIWNEVNAFAAGKYVTVVPNIPDATFDVPVCIAYKTKTLGLGNSAMYFYGIANDGDINRFIEVQVQYMQNISHQTCTITGWDVTSKEIGDVTNEALTIQLATKQNLLQSGINIKTINGQSILGGGNLNLDFLTMVAINELPIAGVNTLNKIYLVPSRNPDEAAKNIKEEWVTIQQERDITYDGVDYPIIYKGEFASFLEYGTTPGEAGAGTVGVILLTSYDSSTANISSSGYINPLGWEGKQIGESSYTWDSFNPKLGDSYVNVNDHKTYVCTPTGWVDIESLPVIYNWELIGSTQVNLDNYYTKTEVNTALNNKQDTLQSGTNIKTINGSSILGRGNINIEKAYFVDYGDVSDVRRTIQNFADNLTVVCRYASESDLLNLFAIKFDDSTGILYFSGISGTNLYRCSLNAQNETWSAISAININDSEVAIVTTNNTFAEVEALYNAGKLLILKDSNEGYDRYLPLVDTTSGRSFYFQVLITNVEYDCELDYQDGWSNIRTVIMAPDAKFANYYTKSEVNTALNGKQDTISDLATIRSGASAGATAVQPATLNSALSNTVAESGVFDLSVHNAVNDVPATYTSLSAALTALNALPAAYKKGGMSFKFIQGTAQSYDNKYVQYRYMGTETTGNPNPFLDTANWQGVDDVPTANSKNLVTSGGVYGALQGEYVVVTATANTGSVATAMVGIYDVNDVLIVEGEGEVTARILYGKTYKVKCSRVYDYLTPTEQTFTASIPSRQVTMQYTYIERDVVTLDQTISDSAQMLSGDIQGDVIKEIRSHSHLYLGTPATQSGDTEGTELLCQLSDEDSRLYYDGTPAVLDGSEGDQWLKLPVFWWKVAGVGEAAADGAHDQYRLMFAFAGEPDPSWNKWQGDRNLVGAKEMKVVNNKGRSVSGGQSTGIFTQAQGNVYAAARNIGCQQVTWEWQWMMCILCYAWNGDTNSQKTNGIGSDSYTRTLGVTDQLGMTDTTPAQATSLTSARFWGLEAWWNCKVEWMGNVVMENYVLRITDQDTKQTRQVNGFIQCGGTGGWNSRMRIDANGDFVPLAKAGTETTYYCDWVNSNSGSRVLNRSNYYANAYGGVAYVSASFAPSFTSAYIGSRLAFNGVITEAESVAAYKAALA